MSATQQALLMAAGGSTLTWNPSDKDGLVTLSNGNLTATDGVLVRATGSASTGKKYYEIAISGSSANDGRIGIAPGAMSTNTRVGAGTNSYAWLSGTGYTMFNGSVAFQGSPPTWGAGDIIGVAVDLTNGYIWWAKNNTWINDISGNVGNPSTGANPRYTGVSVAAPQFPAASPESGRSITVRFRASSWTYSPPTGFGEWA